MKLLITSVLLGFACINAAWAQMQVVTNQDLPSVFAGGVRDIPVVFHNPGNELAEAQINTQLYQATSATIAPIGKPVDWKKLQVLPGQTVMESISLDFPAVKAETKFLVQWMVDTNILGTTEVMAYPTNLLAKLKTLAGEPGFGVYDPQNQIKPLLKKLEVDFEDLEDSGLEHFAGRLAIIGPFKSREQMRDGLPVEMKELARKNTGVVWLLPPSDKKYKSGLLPSFYSVMESTNAIVVVQPELVSRLPENPQAQLNLIYFCQQALAPRSLTLPVLPTRP